jgi:hypothetical protein
LGVTDYSQRKLGNISRKKRGIKEDMGVVLDLCDAMEDCDLQTCELAIGQPPLSKEGVAGVPPPALPGTGMVDGLTQLSPAQQSSVARIAETIAGFFPERSGVNELEALEAVALRAFKRADLDYNIDDAVAEAGDFHMAEEDCARDCAEFNHLPVDEAGMVDIGAMVEGRKGVLASNRLCRARVEKSLSRANPHYDKVMALAEQGMRVRELLGTCGPGRDPSSSKRRQRSSGCSRRTSWTRAWP